jgi:transposase
MPFSPFAAWRRRRGSIGVDHAGVLQRDGWQSYRQFHRALHQTCLAHLLRRCRILLLDYPQHPFVTAVKATRQAALAVRERYRDGCISAHGLATARGLLSERLGRLLERAPSRHLRVRRFQRHLIVEYDAIFSFLVEPTLDAHQLARRTGPAPRRGHPQNVRRRQPHRTGR